MVKYRNITMILVIIIHDKNNKYTTKYPLTNTLIFMFKQYNHLRLLVHMYMMQKLLTSPVLDLAPLPD